MVDNAPNRGYNEITFKQETKKLPETGHRRQNMKATLTKIEKSWTIIIERADGTRNDYRFSTKREATKWAAQAGLEI